VVKWLNTLGGTAGATTARLAGAPWWAIVVIFAVIAAGTGLGKLLESTFPQDSADRLALWRDLFKLESRNPPASASLGAAPDGAASTKRGRHRRRSRAGRRGQSTV
jgi:hypothetical protein